MTQTKAAIWWLAVAKDTLVEENYRWILVGAQQVAWEQGAHTLGKNHCELALVRIAKEGGNHAVS